MPEFQATYNATTHEILRRIESFSCHMGPLTSWNLFDRTLGKVPGYLHGNMLRTISCIGRACTWFGTQRQTSRNGSCPRFAPKSQLFLQCPKHVLSRNLNRQPLYSAASNRLTAGSCKTDYKDKAPGSNSPFPVCFLPGADVLKHAAEAHSTGLA